MKEKGSSKRRRRMKISDNPTLPLTIGVVKSFWITLRRSWIITDNGRKL